MAGWRGALLSAGSGMKSALGLMFLIIGFLIITGAEKRFEAFLVDVSPQWLIDLSTQF